MDTGGREKRWAVSLFGTMEKAVWNSRNWLVQHHTVEEKAVKIQLFFLPVCFLPPHLFKILLFFLLSRSLHTPHRVLLDPCFLGLPLPSVSWSVLCLHHSSISVFTKWLPYFYHLTGSLEAHAAHPLLSTLSDQSRSHTVLCNKTSQNILNISLMGSCWTDLRFWHLVEFSIGSFNMGAFLIFPVRECNGVR